MTSEILVTLLTQVTHVAPLGLGGEAIHSCYRHAAPLGLC